MINGSKAVTKKMYKLLYDQDNLFNLHGDMTTEELEFQL